MVEDPVDLKPLWAHPVAIVALLQIVWVFLERLVSPVGAAVVEGRWFIHVVLTHVVTIHRWMVHVQLSTDLSYSYRNTDEHQQDAARDGVYREVHCTRSQD